MNFNFVGNIIGALMFSDKADIFRFSDDEDEDGATKTVLDLTGEPIHSQVPCRISFVVRRQDLFKNYPDVVEHDKQPKLFFYADCDVQQGDYIKAYKMNGEEVLQTYEGQCAIPNQIGSHIEVPLNAHKEA